MTTARDATGTTSPVRAAFGLTALVGVVAAAVAALAAGLAGLAGSLLGTGLVVTFFALGHIVLTRLRGVDPAQFFLIAMLTYVLQVVCLLAVFGAVAGGSADVSEAALGITIIVGTLAWTTGLVLSSKRQRIPLFDLEQRAR